VVIGCAVLGGLLIVGGAVAFILGMYWLTSPGRQYATSALASPQSHGVIRVNDLAADPGARALLTAFVKRVQEAGQGPGQPQLPAWIRNLQAHQARQGVSQWLPREATVSLEPDDEGVPRIVLAANLRGFVRPIRLALTQATKSDRKARITRHGDHEILNVSGDVAVCFLDGTLVVSYHPKAMAPALDRLAAGSLPSPADARTLPGPWDATGWLGPDAGAGLLIHLLEPGAEEDEESSQPQVDPVLETLREVRFGIDVESAEDGRVVAEMAFANATDAADTQPWLADRVARLRERMEASGLSSTVTDSLDGDRIRYEVRLNGLATALDRVMQAREHPRRRRSEP